MVVLSGRLRSGPATRLATMWYEIVTTHQFWAGVVSTGVLGGVWTYLNNRFSDKRKFKQEDKTLGRKETREDLTQAQKDERENKLREEQTLIAAADEFTQICSGILVDTIDTEGAFNTIRDLMNNLQGKDDTAAEKKISHGQKVADAQKRIAAPHWRLKMTANSPDVLAASDKVVTSLLAVARMTTEPLPLSWLRRSQETR